jgi:hypothetical protein
MTGGTLRDSRIGPCGGAAVQASGGASVVIEHNWIAADIERGIQINNTSDAKVRKNQLTGVRRVGDFKHAIEASYTEGVTIDGNAITGAWRSDIISVYQSSRATLTGNIIRDVSIDEPTGASFTMGDATNGKPGRDNYVARNIVERQSGGVPAGVFGSEGNTVLEFNCFGAGIQAYNYSGVFVGVTVRNNVINLSSSYVPNPSSIAGWSTNINSTDCSRVP